jgi:hypothetical protein
MQEALVLFIAYLNRVSSTGSSEPLVKDNIDICLPTTVDVITQKLNAKYSAIIYTYVNKKKCWCWSLLIPSYL